ncbi:hypothetical protein HGO21_35095 [Acinetobacter sp. CUI P1]|nr:hypothetical protein [Acinetobacter sp. CUI P1]
MIKSYEKNTGDQSILVETTYKIELEKEFEEAIDYIAGRFNSIKNFWFGSSKDKGLSHD